MTPRSRTGTDAPTGTGAPLQALCNWLKTSRSLCLTDFGDVELGQKVVENAAKHCAGKQVENGLNYHGLRWFNMVLCGLIWLYMIYRDDNGIVLGY